MSCDAEYLRCCRCAETKPNDPYRPFQFNLCPSCFDGLPRAERRRIEKAFWKQADRIVLSAPKEPHK